MFGRRDRTTVEHRTLWLVKDDPDGAWWCKCPQGIVDAPDHDEHTYPTGGSGWLFCCVKCGLSFPIARAVRIRATLEELAARQTPRTQSVWDPRTDTTEEHVLLVTPEDWLKIARPIQTELTEGQRYVFFDGRVLPAVHGPVKFRGLWRSHDLPDLPHISDLPECDVLADPHYWLEEREDEAGRQEE